MLIIKTMKHLFMAFMILFASLSSSWASVLVSSDKTAVSVSSQQVFKQSVDHSNHAKLQMDSHDVCPSHSSSSASITTSTSSTSEPCPHGFGECQCGAGCSMNSPMAMLSESLVHNASQQQASNASFRVDFNQTFLQTLDRPPQAS